MSSLPSCVSGHKKMTLTPCVALVGRMRLATQVHTAEQVLLRASLRCGLPNTPASRGMQEALYDRMVELKLCFEARLGTLEGETEQGGPVCGLLDTPQRALVSKSSAVARSRCARQVGSFEAGELAPSKHANSLAVETVQQIAKKDLVIVPPFCNRLIFPLGDGLVVGG
jgi:hypothetical protein